MANKSFVDVVSKPKQTPTRLQSATILGSSLIAAVTTLLVTVIVKNVLQGSELNEFLVFWSLLFALYGVPTGIASEITRATGDYRAKVHGKSTARVLHIALGLGSLVVIFTGITSFFWGDSQFPTSTHLSVLLICASVLTFSVQNALISACAGRSRWGKYATLIGLEPVLRFILVVVVSLTSVSLLGLEVAVSVPVGLWLLFVLFSRDARAVLMSRADVMARQFVKNIFMVAVTAIFVSLLLTGMPNILKASEQAAAIKSNDASLGILILAILITRAPILLPLNALQSLAVKSFMQHRNHPIRALLKPSVLLLLVGVFGGMLAFIIGPVLFRFIYPPKPDELIAYDAMANGYVLAALTVAGALLGVVMLMGSATLAGGYHKFYLLTWVVTAFVTIIILFLPLDLLVRTMTALYVGPIIGIVLNTLLLSKQREQSDKDLF